MRYALRFWGTILAIVAAIMGPLAVAGWVAGTTGVLVMAGVYVAAFFGFITLMFVEDMKVRDEALKRRDAARDRSYSRPLVRPKRGDQ
jgi:mannose/fructose/N-acetylgalactosamine-specific phosphotransferase system component IID